MCDAQLFAWAMARKHVPSMWSRFVLVWLFASTIGTRWLHDLSMHNDYVNTVAAWIDHAATTCAFPLKFQVKQLAAAISNHLRSQSYLLEMPKHLIPAGWVEKPCRFFSHESTASTCGSCEGEFGLLNGRRHCSFCGHVFHRRQCTRKLHVDGLFFRRRICQNCDYYRNVASEKLKQGA